MLVHPHGVLGADELEAAVLVVGGVEDGGLGGRRGAGGVRVVDAVPPAALAYLLRPHLEDGDPGGDVAAGPPGEDLEDAVEEEVAGHAGGQAVEAVAGVVDAVLDVVGEVADLLHPVLGVVVVAAPRRRSGGRTAWWRARR